LKQNSEEFNQIFAVSFLKKLQLSGLDFEFWHTPNGGTRNKAEAGKMKLMGLLAGVPDISLMAMGKFQFIEFKKPKGTLSKEQRDFISKATRYGWPVHTIVADNPAECIAQVSDVMLRHFGADQNSISSISASVLASSVLSSSPPSGKEKS
jgi:hypothetical protein